MPFVDGRIVCVPGDCPARAPSPPPRPSARDGGRFLGDPVPAPLPVPSPDPIHTECVPTLMRPFLGVIDQGCCSGCAPVRCPALCPFKPRPPALRTFGAKESASKGAYL